MRMFNADGSEAQMCGNGIRCFAKFVYDRGLKRQETLRVETLAGMMKLDLTVEKRPRQEGPRQHGPAAAPALARYR